MQLNAYTLYDTKSLAYSPPFFCGAHGQAVRMVIDLASDTNNMVGRHPADFTLYCIGVFDDQSGQLLPAGVREHISDVIALAPRRQPTFFGQPEDTAGAGANGADPASSNR